MSASVKEENETRSGGESVEKIVQERTTQVIQLPVYVVRIVTIGGNRTLRNEVIRGLKNYGIYTPLGFLIPSKELYDKALEFVKNLPPSVMAAYGMMNVPAPFIEYYTFKALADRGTALLGAKYALMGGPVGLVKYASVSKGYIKDADILVPVIAFLKYLANVYERLGLRAQRSYAENLANLLSVVYTSIKSEKALGNVVERTSATLPKIKFVVV